MPYVKQCVRTYWRDVLDYFTENELQSATLNYIITSLLLKTNPQNYEDFNSLIGVLECVKLELYRRMVAPYEDQKRKENGDVY